MSKNAGIIRDAETRARASLPIDSKKVRELESESRDEQRMLSLNAWHLARYLIEHEKVPEWLDIGQFLEMAEDYPQLSEEKKIAFINQYAQLEAAAGEVTARTLYATRVHGKSFLRAVFTTSVGNYLFLLIAITLAFASLLLAHSLYVETHAARATIVWPLFVTSKMVVPFYAAGLGACVYLLRVTQNGLQNRTFDPARIPSHMIRLGLGTLAGGTIVFFPGLLDGVSTAGAGTGAASAPAATATLGSGIVAFIFGYAVDIYYKVLDRIGGEIGGASETTKPHADGGAKGARA